MMSFSVSISFVLVVVLLATRLSPLFLFAPPLSSVPVPARVRTLLVLMLAMSLAMLKPAAAASFTHVPNAFQLMGMLLMEACSGALIALGLIGAFSSVSLAGRLLDLQIGFGVANLFDPVTKRQGPLLGAALGMLAAALFFATDSHLLLFRILADSLSSFPPGVAIWQPELVSWVAKQFGYMIFSGVALAFPVMLILSMIDIGLALSSKSVPQLGVFFLSLPIKAALGLTALALLLILNPGAFSRVVWQWFSFVSELLRS